MRSENLPEAADAIKAGKRSRQMTIAPADLDFIRTNAPKMQDPAMAAALGWPLWRVINVRHRFGIEPFTLWPEDVLAIIKRRYMDDGEPARAIAKDLGLLPASLTRKCRNMGWVQSEEVKRANLRAGALASSRVYSKNCAVRKKAKPAPKAAHAPVVVPVEAPRRQFNFTASTPIVFAAPRAETETLGDRILRELSAKPLSAASLATLLGEKEELVGRQLRVFDYEGVVVGGVVDERGLRYRPWSLCPSRAETAASLRCGPDSLVVAGEAA